MKSFLKSLYKKITLPNRRRYVLFLFDAFCFAFIAFVLFFLMKASDSIILGVDAGQYTLYALVLFGCVFVCRIIFNIYVDIWRYTSTSSYFRLAIADVLGGAIAYLIAIILNEQHLFWQFVIIDALSLIITLSSRFAYRLVYKRHNAKNKVENQIKVAIVGAGQIGALLANELRSNQNSKYVPVCFIDVDNTKIDAKLMGLKVFDEKDTAMLVDLFNIDEFIIAVSDTDGERIHKLYEFYGATQRKVMLYGLPVHENQDADSTKRVIREFQIEDLLFRKPIEINDEKTFNYYTGKVVLVTGGGGSIGSELCRQIAKCKPKKLVIFDIYENNAYDIQQELIRKYGAELDLYAEIGSVRDRKRLESLFRTYQPNIVFHAAAHKHVPLMERSSGEAIKNNVLGTYNTADMAEKFGVEKFVLVSTDKAVNPTNVMGASKRLCEMVVQCRIDSKTSFCAVRFGNVLGSNGSVIPLFKRQIASGGPLTLTDKRIIRYFMTIPEASSLVIQAGAMAKSGELFVLDMGKPVKIYDLAVNMIKLSGLEPEKDIKIEEIGLRPGEKLYEELLMKTETLDKTDNNMIFIERDKPLLRAEVEEKLSILKEAVEASDRQDSPLVVKEAVRKVVPTFHDPEEVNEKAQSAEEMKLCEDEDKQ